MESVLRLKLPWTLLRHNLAAVDDNGNILYMSCLDGYKFDSAVPQVRLFLFYADRKFYRACYYLPIYLPGDPKKPSRARSQIFS